MSRRKKHRAAAPGSVSARAVAASSRPWHAFVLGALALLGLSFALYWTSLRNPPVFDDANLRDAFFREYLSLAPAVRKLSYVTFSWTWLIAGYDWIAHRLVNVALHGAAAVALLQFLSRLFGVVLGRREPWLAFLGAALFALHPVAVYGVAYLMQRSIIMATLFSLLSLICLLEGLLRRSALWYAAAALLYAAAVLSKEHAVTLPAVALALVLLVRGAPSRREIALLAVPFAAFATIAVMAVLAMKGLIGAVDEPWWEEAQARVEAQGDPALLYALSAMNQAHLFFRYLITWLVPWPGWMSIDVRTAFPSGLIAWPQTAGFVAWLVYPFACGWLLLRRGRAGLVGFALLYPWLFSLVELGTTRLQEPLVLYRSYLWMSGLPAAVPALAALVPARWAIGLLAASCAAYVPLARDRLETFSSAYALWDDAVRKSAGSSAPLVERAYVQRGLAAFELGDLRDAARDFAEAQRINPRYADAHLGMYNVHQVTGEIGLARQDFETALKLSRVYAGDWTMRCNSRVSLRQLKEAREDCARAVELDPGNAELREIVRNLPR